MTKVSENEESYNAENKAENDEFILKNLLELENLVDVMRWYYERKKLKSFKPWLSDVRRIIAIIEEYINKP